MNAITPLTNVPPIAAGVVQEAAPRFRFSIMLVIWLAVTLTAILVTLLLPESYCSTARILVRGSLAQHLPPHDSSPLLTEAEVIKSEAILSKVIELLALNEIWGNKFTSGTRLKTKDSIEILRGRLTIGAVRGTSLIRIDSYSEDRDEAMRIANAVAEVYQNYCTQRRLEATAATFRSLEEALQQNRDQVRKLQIQLATFGQKPDPTNNHAVAEIESSLADRKQFGEAFARRIANETVEARLADRQNLEIVDRAVPANNPTRPNKPLNIILGVLFGGLVGCVFATLVYLLQLRAYRRRLAQGGAFVPGQIRLILHATIALVVGVMLGYNLAMPLEQGRLFLMQLALILGGVASAFIELARPDPAAWAKTAPTQ